MQRTSLLPRRAGMLLLNSGLAVGLAIGLAGCMNDDDDAETQATTSITAAADTLTLEPGQSGQLLANDRLGSAVASSAAGGNVSFALTSTAPPTGW